MNDIALAKLIHVKSCAISDSIEESIHHKLFQEEEVEQEEEDEEKGRRGMLCSRKRRKEERKRRRLWRRRRRKKESRRRGGGGVGEDKVGGLDDLHLHLMTFSEIQSINKFDQKVMMLILNNCNYYRGLDACVTARLFTKMATK